MRVCCARFTESAAWVTITSRHLGTHGSGLSAVCAALSWLDIYSICCSCGRRHGGCSGLLAECKPHPNGLHCTACPAFL